MYLLDANVLMEAHRSYYGFAIAPGFWIWLAGEHQRGTVGSVDAIHAEISVGKDELARWAATLPDSFWLAPSDRTVQSVQRATTWVSEPARRYTQAAVMTFMASADLMLIAEAHAGEHILVTRERSAPEARSRVMIPDVCSALGVRRQDPFTVYRRLGMRLTA